MSAIIDAAFWRGEVNQIFMIEADFAAGMARFWNGVGALDYGGNVYQGAGELISVEGLRTGTEIEVAEIRFRLNGVDSDILGGVLDASIKGRFAEVYEAFLDAEFRVIERELMTRCRLDTSSYTIGDDGKVSVEIVTHAGMYQLLNRSAAKCSPEEAKALFPAETGFDEVHLQEDIASQWKPS